MKRRSILQAIASVACLPSLFRTATASALANDQPSAILRPSYEELKKQIKARDWYHETVEGWFDFIESRGWTAEDLRNADNVHRRELGNAPIPPCSRCGRYHNNLQISLRCGFD